MTLRLLLFHGLSENLRQLGIPVSVGINSLYRQIIYKRGILFPVTLPNEPQTLDAMTADELQAMLEHSYAQLLTGKGHPAKDVFDALERGHSLRKVPEALQNEIFSCRRAERKVKWKRVTIKILED